MELPPSEPVAIVGMSALYPRARGVEAFWDLVTATRLRCACTDPPAAGGDPTGRPAFPHGLLDVEVDVARFKIPPAQSLSMTRMQKLMLEVARQALDDAGLTGRPVRGERFDVIVGVCAGLDRQYRNALRIEALRLAADLRRAGEDSLEPDIAKAAEAAADELLDLLEPRLGGSPHDRVGEMASTIPARIASVFKLRGRTMALEAADATSMTALSHAVGSLRRGDSDTVLVVAGQLRESDLLAGALEAKGLTSPCGHPFAGPDGGFSLAEGVSAVLLKRLPDAVAEGDRIYAVIRGCAIGQDSHPGTFRYSVSAERRREVAELAYRDADVSADTVGMVECFGSGVRGETEAELTALSDIFAGSSSKAGKTVLGSIRDRLGHTFANAGLASLIKTALALHHGTLPPAWSPVDTPPAPGSGFRFPAGAQRWERSGSPRRAAISGASLTGILGHLVLEEHESVPAPSARRPVRVREGEAIAVISWGAQFAGAGGPAAVWDVFRSGQDRIAPLPDRILDRELYFDPSVFSLTHTYTDQGSPVPVPDAPPRGLPITPRRWTAMDAAQRVALNVAAQLFSGGGPQPAALHGPGLIAVGSSLSLGRERALNSAAELDLAARTIPGLDALAHLEGEDRRRLAARTRRRFGAPEDPDAPHALDGWLASGTAALIAGEFHLAAVPVAVEAACASSLAALDLAVGALRSGTARYAIAGGVELACNVRDLILCSSLGLLSHSKITPFDAAADGFSPGDGCALFLLKRHSDAMKDGDRILGVIRGVGGSNDAHSLIAPDRGGQARAMRQAFGDAGFGPDTVDYLEAHGTGTRVGDRVELSAVTDVYGGGERPRPLQVGSAKSFFGHTFAAAGAAGLLRVLLALQAGTFPPNANLRTLSPELDLDAIPAFIDRRPAPWPAGRNRPRRAALSSFGTGGINYHVLIEEHPDGES